MSEEDIDLSKEGYPDWRTIYDEKYPLSVINRDVSIVRNQALFGVKVLSTDNNLYPVNGLLSSGDEVDVEPSEHTDGRTG